MRSLALATLFAALATAASADTVILKNGGRLEGVTTKIEDGKLVVTLQSGTVRFNREDIAKVIHRVTPMEEYQTSAAKLKKDDAKGHFELAAWCAENDLKHFQRVELEATIAAESDHKEAREQLGYEKVGGKWLRGEELLKAKGMVKVDGKWMTKEAAQAIAADKERKRLDRALLEAQRKAERDAAEEDAERLREFYDSSQRARSRIDSRPKYFDGRRSPRPYPRRYWYDWSVPYSYTTGGSYYYVGTVGYGYYPGIYTGFYSPRYYYPGVGIRYTSSSGRYSFSFGTNWYGYGYGYSPYYYGSGYSSQGRYVPGTGGTSPGYFSSSGAFDRGGNPHYGGSR